MIPFSEFHFLRPEWFWALPALCAIAFLWLRRSLSRRGWAELCDARLLPYILERRPERGSRFPVLLFILAALLSVVALAGPAWKRLPQPVYRNESALVIVLDLSKSMDAEDIQPSRLGRARYKISDILQQRKDGLTALTVYSDQAYVVTPLTEDRATILNQLPALETAIMPTQGTRAATALQRAVQLLKQSGNSSGNVLLITDGVDQKAQDAAEELKQNGYRLHVLGIGSEEGAPIPVAGGGFIKDLDGNIVITRLKTDQLDSLARSGGGSYQTLTLDDRDIRSLFRSFDESTGFPHEGREARQADQWVEEGPWLLLGVLPIAAFAFRRGYLMVLVLLTLPWPGTVYAWQWKDLWQTPDQQGYEAFQQRDYERAAQSFEDPAWKAASEYSARRYQKALENLNDLETPSASYNKGNALARAGRFPEALEAYNQALKLDPKDHDARYNRDLIEKIMQQKDPPENPSAQNNDSSDNRQSSPANRENSASNESKNEQAGQKAGKPDHSDQASENTGQAPAGDRNQPSRSPEGQSGRKQQGPLDEPEVGTRKAASAQAAQRARAAENTPEQEIQQANEQWLRRIPDDPGGLLRRKFLYQYRRTDHRPASDEPSW